MKKSFASFLAITLVAVGTATSSFGQEAPFQNQLPDVTVAASPTQTVSVSLKVGQVVHINLSDAYFVLRSSGQIPGKSLCDYTSGHCGEMQPSCLELLFDMDGQYSPYEYSFRAVSPGVQNVFFSILDGDSNHQGTYNNAGPIAELNVVVTVDPSFEALKK